MNSVKMFCADFRFVELCEYGLAMTSLNSETSLSGSIFGYYPSSLEIEEHVTGQSFRSLSSWGANKEYFRLKGLERTTYHNLNLDYNDKLRNFEDLREMP